MNYYKILKDGHNPSPLSWHSVSDCLPEAQKDECFDFRSKDVLLFDSFGNMFIGFLIEYEGGKFPSEWILKGKDDHTVENITHWRWLPMPPR